jgi:hypothetical protein
VLRSDDEGYEILVRTASVPEALEAARQDAAKHSQAPGELVPAGSGLQAGWWRSVPLQRDHHLEDCHLCVSPPGCGGADGRQYVRADGPGRGAFRAVAVNVVQAGDLEGAEEF